MIGARIGILGGTFDPIHLGHIIPAEYAFNHLRLDRLLVVPSGPPIHRPRHAPAAAEHRLAMCRLACAALPSFEVSDVEVVRAEPSYTVLTLEHFRRAFGTAAELFLLVGEDNLALLHTWHRMRDVLKLCSVVPLRRPGGFSRRLDGLREIVGDDGIGEILGRLVPGPLVAISGPEVRRLVSEGKSIKGLVPESVAEYITSHGLYRRCDL